MAERIRRVCSVDSTPSYFPSGAIRTNHLKNLSVTTAKIANLAITNAQIANATITDAQIASLSATKITAGTLTSITINGGASFVDYPRDVLSDGRGTCGRDHHQQFIGLPESVDVPQHQGSGDRPGIVEQPVQHLLYASNRASVGNGHVGTGHRGQRRRERCVFPNWCGDRSRVGLLGPERDAEHPVVWRDEGERRESHSDLSHYLHAPERHGDNIAPEHSVRYQLHGRPRSTRAVF